MSDKCIIGFWDTIEVDRALRIAASGRRITKSELLREIVADWLRNERSATTHASAGESPATNEATFSGKPPALAGDQKDSGGMNEEGE